MIIPVRRISDLLVTCAGHFLGLNQDTSTAARRGTRIGLFVSGAFLVSVGLLIVLVPSLFVVLALPIFLFGGYNLVTQEGRRCRLAVQIYSRSQATSALPWFFTFSSPESSGSPT